jgi:hypothetical protein
MAEQLIAAPSALIVSEGLETELVFLSARITLMEKGWRGIRIGTRFEEYGARIADAPVPSGADLALYADRNSSLTS